MALVNGSPKLMDLADVCSVFLLGLKEESSNIKSEQNKCNREISDIAVRKIVNEYTASIANEVQKQFSVICKLDPEKCSQVFTSYRSENKAEKLMKEHFLNDHGELVEQKINGTSPPKEDTRVSPESAVKSSKRRRKAQHPSGIKRPTKSSKPPKSATSVSMKALWNGPKVEKLKKAITPESSTRNPSRQGFSVCNEQIDEITEEIIQERTYEICGPLCDHTNCSKSLPSTSQNGLCVVYAKSKVTELKCQSTPQRLMPNEYVCFSSQQEANQYSIMIEHSYATTKGGIKVEKLPTKIKVGKRQTRCCLEPQRIICTPQFPYVHIPLLPDCSEIQETVAIDNFTDEKPVDVDNSSGTRETNINVKKKSAHFIRPPKKGAKNNRNPLVSGSVLECLENRVNINSSVIRMPIRADENAENIENLHGMNIEAFAKKLLDEMSSRPRREGPATCIICGKIFTACSTLAHHLRGHAKIKLYYCEICKNRFTRKHSLKYHLMIHNNKSRFLCKQCDRKFRHPSHYKEHLRRHTGETPFECAICLPVVKFKTRNTYKRHLRMSHKIRLTKTNAFEDMRND